MTEWFEFKEKLRTNRELQDLQKEFQRLEAKEKMEITSKRKLQGWEYYKNATPVRL